MMESWIIWALVIMNVVTFGVYGYDKFCAKKNLWRIPEKTLLLLALCGGSVGAILGMNTFRHKTQHKKFLILVPLFLFIHLAIAAWLLWGPQGA